KKYLKLKKQQAHLQQSAAVAEGKSKKGDGAGDDTEYALKRLAQEALTERSNNFFTSKRLLGHPVNFGQAMQLEHVKSGKLLTVCPKEVADQENNCQKVGLKELGSPDSWWNIKPRYKLQGTTQAVRYVETVSIESEKHSHLLHCAARPIPDAALEAAGIHLHEALEAAGIHLHEVHSPPACDF
ncbi:inositol 1,4,5-trisphosphate/ryanodine receptor-domain-containing protein, partial [Baffinella frigidus]